MVPALATPMALADDASVSSLKHRETAPSKAPSRPQAQSPDRARTRHQNLRPKTWLRRLKEKIRLRIDNQATIDRLPPNTSIASVGPYVIHRQMGETLRGLHRRVRASIGESAVIEWESDGPEKTKLDIVQDHLQDPSS